MILTLQYAVRQAAAQTGIPKRVSPPTFRHSFASYLLLANYDIHTIQRLLRHSDVKVTMILYPNGSERDVEGSQKPVGPRRKVAVSPATSEKDQLTEEADRELKGLDKR